MHNNKSTKVLALINKDFANMLLELQDYLNFNVKITNQNINIQEINSYDVLIVDEESQNILLSKEINNLSLPILLIVGENNIVNIAHNLKIKFPFEFHELNKAIINLITKKNYSINSSIKIKDYVLNKNQKKLIKNKQTIILTEKEIQLLELFNSAKKPIPKENILELIWKYSADADTHTVETHIYRLRKKIKDKFFDNDLIINNKKGYTI